MVTLADVARRLGVSTATVSNALRGKGRISAEKRQLILRAAAEMGYTASSAREQAEGNVVVLAETVRVDFTGRILQGITAACIRHACSFPIYDMGIFNRGLPIGADGAQLAPVVEEITQRLPPFTSGILYLSQYPRDISGLFRRMNIPVLFVFATGEADQVSINYDDEQGASLAVQHLVDAGRRRIAMLSGPIDSKSMNDRLYGYQRTLIANGMGFDPKLVWIGNWRKASGYQKTLELLRQTHKPDAIFVQNDAMATGALQALSDAGLRVPEDIAVIGFDNSGWAEAASPALSSIAPPFAEMGEAAVDLIRAMVRGEAVHERHIMLPCSLVARKST